MRAHQIFISIFNAVTAEVPFSMQWKNGTGYLDGACYAAFHMASGEVAKTTDDKNRKVLIAATDYGNVVVFERYTDGESGTIVCNFPNEIDRDASGLGYSSITEEHLNKMFSIKDGKVINHIDDLAVARK